MAKAEGCEECNLAAGTCPRSCTIPGDLGITGAFAAAPTFALFVLHALVAARGIRPPPPPAPHGSPPLAWPRAENDVAIFHISLWSSVFLVLATCYAGCALSYMDTGDDSIFNIDISAGVKKVGAHGIFALPWPGRCGLAPGRFSCGPSGRALLRAPERTLNAENWRWRWH